MADPKNKPTPNSVTLQEMSEKQSAVAANNAELKKASDAAAAAGDASVSDAKKAGKGMDGIEPGRYMAKVRRMVHPYTNQVIPDDRDVVVTEIDSWFVLQVQAGLLVKVG